MLSKEYFDHDGLWEKLLQEYLGRNQSTRETVIWGELKGNNITLKSNNDIYRKFSLQLQTKDQKRFYKDSSLSH